jgi:uncharacterized protein (DUF4415 family)
MLGSKTNVMTRKQALAAARAVPASDDFVWDGVDADERPMTKEEMQTGIEVMRVKRGRPPGTTKEQVAIRFDHEVLNAFRSAGPGWQTRMNEALKDWLRTHTVA